MGTFDDNRRHHRESVESFRRIEFRLDPPAGDIGLRREVERFPFVPADPHRLEHDCYEAYNIQVAGLEQRLRALSYPKRGHRRFGWAGLYPRADRRRSRDGPGRPAAQRHSGVYAARLRDWRAHQTQCGRVVPRTRRHLRRNRHHRHRQADAQGDRSSVLPGREGLRRHLRERPGRPAHRLPLPAGQPARWHRAGHRRPLRAGVGLVDLRCRRPDVALQRQRRRAQDADPAPDPLGHLIGPVRVRGRRGAAVGARHRDHPGTGSNR